jgi:hypothetical protein
MSRVLPFEVLYLVKPGLLHCLIADESNNASLSLTLNPSSMDIREYLTSIGVVCGKSVC